MVAARRALLSPDNSYFIWLRLAMVMYCSFAPIVLVGYGIVANSKTIIDNISVRWEETH